MEVPLIWCQMFTKRDEAILLAYLCNRRNMLKRRGKLPKDGWMYCTTATVQKDSKLNKHAQARILKSLEAAGLIKRAYEPLPNKKGKGRDARWIKVMRKRIHKVTQMFRLGDPAFNKLRRATAKTLSAMEKSPMDSKYGRTG